MAQYEQRQVYAGARHSQPAWQTPQEAYRRSEERDYRNVPPRPRRRKRRVRRKSRWWLLIVVLLAIALGLTGVFRLIESARGGSSGGMVSGAGDVGGATGDISGAGYGATISNGPPWVVALDAGHGGSDVGAEGLVNEVDLNDLTVAKLHALLEADPDFTPALTRQAGQGATPKERVNAAADADASLFLSIHGNSDASSDTTGFECFPSPPGRKWHTASMSFAQLVASEMGAAGAKLRGEGGVRFAYYDSGGNKYFVEASDTSVSRDKSYGVVEGAPCPAVLAEQCFITSPADMEFFGAEAGAQRAAEAYYRAIVSYFKGLL